MYRLTIEYSGPVDPETFDRHYRDVHVPLVRALPGLARFTTSKPRALGGEAPYLVAELWFEDGDAMKAAMKSTEMAAAAADAQTFEVERMVMFTGEVTEAG